MGLHCLIIELVDGIQWSSMCFACIHTNGYVQASVCYITTCWCSLVCPCVPFWLVIREELSSKWRVDVPVHEGAIPCIFSGSWCYNACKGNQPNVFMSYSIIYLLWSHLNICSATYVCFLVCRFLATLISRRGRKRLASRRSHFQR